MLIQLKETTRKKIDVYTQFPDNLTLSILVSRILIFYVFNLIFCTIHHQR
jgi:hypothetical protein